VGEDWRNSRFVYAISSVQALIFQIQTVVKRLLAVNNSLLRIIVSENDTFAQGIEVDAFSQHNWISLKEPADLPESLRNDPRFIKQRSPEWFEERKAFRLTGSRLFEGLGLDTLKNQTRHFDKVVKNMGTDEVISNDVRQRMEHGTQSEIHAIATLVGKVLPFYYPDLKYIEEGTHIVQCQETPFILVSPDGSLGRVDLDSRYTPTPFLACEFKCPVALWRFQNAGSLRDAVAVHSPNSRRKC
jgi:hypothetical protein